MKEGDLLFTPISEKLTSIKYENIQNFLQKHLLKNKLVTVNLKPS